MTAPFMEIVGAVAEMMASLIEGMVWSMVMEVVTNCVRLSLQIKMDCPQRSITSPEYLVPNPTGTVVDSGRSALGNFLVLKHCRQLSVTCSMAAGRAVTKKYLLISFSN